MTEDSKARIGFSRLYVWASNLGLAGFYLYFVLTNIQSLEAGFKLSVFFLVLFNTSVVVLALVRRAPQAVTRSVFDYVVAFFGTLSPLLFLGLPETRDNVGLLALQVGGIIFSYAGLLSLNRSFGLVPADRGIVTSGLYRFVRHPLYAGYIMLCLGFMLQNFSYRNVVAFVAFLVFESVRLLIEEQFLAQNPVYAAYMKKVRWRVIPGVW